MKGPIIDCFFFLFKKKKTTSFFFFYKLHRAYEVHAFDSFPLHFIQFKKKKKQTNKKNIILFFSWTVQWVAPV